MASQAGAATPHGCSALVPSTEHVEAKLICSKGRFEFVKMPWETLPHLILSPSFPQYF